MVAVPRIRRAMRRLPPSARTPKATPADAPAGRVRVRRGNAEDADRLRAELVEAAMQLFAEGGLPAVSVRSVAARVGVSPMSTYRYFADKAELLSGLWLSVIHELCKRIKRAVEARDGGRARHRALIDAFLRYWETHPEHYCLVYGFTAIGQQREARSQVARAGVYTELLGIALGVTESLADEIGADRARAKLASDVRLAMLLGYLHGTLVATRYPWSESKLLREAYLDRVQDAVEQCLRGET